LWKIDIILKKEGGIEFNMYLSKYGVYGVK